ncbi:MAG: transporter permease protein [Acidimicrobiaceae bacterium]|nr:transporter permease protein [Acidimicrobiaceae bacterium]
MTVPLAPEYRGTVSVVRDFVTRTRERHRPGTPSQRVIVGALIVLVLISVTASLWAPYPASAQSGASLAPPSWAHPFGTDELGEDIFVRFIYGIRLSLLVAASTAVVAGVVGAAIGMAAGYVGGLVDSVMMRGVDFMLAFPTLVIAMTIVAIVGPSTATPVLATIVVSIPLFARVARASTLVERQKEYVLAARALGASSVRIMVRQILPAIMPVLRVQAAIAGALAVQLEASLSFLGMGVRPPTPSLGAMLNTARQYLSQSWSYGVFPGLGLFLIIMLLLMLANSMSDDGDAPLAKTG